MAYLDLKRYNNWGARWVEFIKDSMDLASDLVIDWDSEGITCFSWACDGVEALTGYNPHDQFVGQYSNVLGICKVLKGLGCESLDEYVASLFPEVPVGMAQQGDIVLIKADYWSCSEHAGEDLFAHTMLPHGVGLAEPPFYYAVTEKGLVRGDLYREGVRAFAVGREI